ncbi:MAG: glycosyltransferase family 2 protein [Thermoleophilia bacterium]
MSLPDYVVVSPVKDEAASLPRTAESMIGQTHRAREWVIVDDGSSDGTLEIARGYAAEHPWIRVVEAGAGTPRARGGRVVDAFNRGLRETSGDAAVIVKMDGDLFLPPHYFEWVARTFAREPRAGIVGGVLLEHDGAVWRPAGFNPRHVRGAFKAYRRECLEEIGGLRPAMGWDGIDEYGARARGWEVVVLTELVALHYKARGSKQPWRQARFEEGRACHFMGYRADFLLMRMPYRALVDRPPVLGALTVLAGYAWSKVRRAPQIDDPEARKAFRDEQKERMRRMVRRREDLPPPSIEGGGPAFWSDADEPGGTG